MLASPRVAIETTIYTLIATAKLNGVDPQAWLADVLGPHQRS
ncbi:MAG: transposase domain-containing protein [Methylocystis sp.]